MIDMNDLIKRVYDLSLELDNRFPGDIIAGKAADIARDIAMIPANPTAFLIEDIKIQRYGKPLKAALMLCMQLQERNEKLEERMFALARKWQSYANVHSGRHPWAAETLDRCSAELKKEIDENPQK